MTRCFKLAAVVAAACLLSSCVGKFSLIDKYYKDRDAASATRAGEPVSPEAIRDDLGSALSEEIVSENALIEMEDRGIVVTLLDKVLFSSGKAAIKPAGKEALAKVAAVLEDVPNEISIEGHTDNEPINRSRYLYKSNWELSSARATNVLYLLEEQGIYPERMSATGYGEYRPVAENDTKEGRQRNRRVEIVILPEIIRQKADLDVSEDLE